ncbi:MAG: CHASE2 domain-containing protein [Nostoc sp.]|uniref:CHASE2 domain-containing protein n=1 Tax=Nostoc sp. TaxID=1180 RepID=UPI002FF4C975
MNNQTETGKIDLSEHRKELREAIISAYPTKAEFQTMIRDELKRKPDEIVEEGKLTEMVSRLIEWAEAQSQEKQLIEAAYKGNPNNKNLQEITYKLLPNYLPVPPDHLKNEKDKKLLWHQRIRRLCNKKIFLTSTGSVGITTILVIVLRLLGLFEGSELLFFDQMMRLRASENQDNRLLLVKITEKDIIKYSKDQNNPPKNGASLSDEVIYQLLSKLLSKSPRVIAMDIYRSAKAEGNLTRLINNAQTDKRLVFICKFPDPSSNPDGGRHDPPPDVPIEQVGLSDFLSDRDGVIRRQLINMGTPTTEHTQDSNCKNQNGLMNSFSFEVAQKYLEKGDGKTNIDKRYTTLLNKEKNNIVSGSTILPSLENDTQGGYNLKVIHGYQILLNYRYSRAADNSDNRSVSNIAPQFTVQQVLDDRGINENLVKDKIILIGTTTEGYDGLSSTPFSSGGPDNQMQRLFIQAQMVSQLVSGALEERPLIKVCSFEWEILWILFWSLIGAILAQLCKQPLRLIIVGVISFVSLCVICIFLFIYTNFWISLYPCTLAFLSTGGMVVLLEFRSQKKVKTQQTS